MAGAKESWNAQRFPDDYDAIMAIAPTNLRAHQYAGQVWYVQAVTNNPASWIPFEKFPAIKDAALAACDAIDGVQDGLIENARRSSFDPAALLCSGADDLACLTSPQVAAVKKIYTDASNPRTGKQIFPGLERGSELAGWNIIAICGTAPDLQLCTGPTDPTLQAIEGTDFFRYFVFNDPNWNLHG